MTLMLNALMQKNKPYILVLAFIFIVIVNIASAFIIMFLWNFLARYFGFKEINFWVALVIELIWWGFNLGRKATK